MVLNEMDNTFRHLPTLAYEVPIISRFVILLLANTCDVRIMVLILALQAGDDSSILLRRSKA